MAHLSDDQLFGGVLPADWRPLLESLHELDLLAAAAETGSFSALREQAGVLRARLMAQAQCLDEDLPQTLHSSSAEFRLWFTEATLLWTLFAQTGGPVLLDTIGTETLQNYPVDLPSAESERGLLRRALALMFDWTPHELHDIEARIERLTSNLRLKRTIALQLCKFFESGGDGEIKQRAAEFMRQVHGPMPWRAGDVDLVITATAVFLCIPYEGASLTSADYAARPAAEREQIAGFLQRVRTEGQNLKNVRFPAFGVYDTALVSPALIADLTEGVRKEPGFAEMDERLVRETFSTMVTVLATHEADKYLVHDVWGHAWQDALCEFEWTYRDMPRMSDPLGVETGGPFAGKAILAAAFETRDGRSVLRPETLLSIVESDLRRRITVGLNLVVSELLADLVEHKFSRYVAPLPSSSLLPGSPLHMDLSLRDTKQMIHAWRWPYRQLLHDESARERLRGELVTAGVPDPGLAEALEQAARLIENRFGPAFEDSVAVEGTLSSGVRANVLQRTMLGVAALDRAIDGFLADGDARYKALLTNDRSMPRWRCPAACVDFLALLLGWFYEQERALHLWHLDELVTRELGPAMLELEEAIRTQFE